MITLDDIRARDAADPLAQFRDRFDLPEGVNYLDGNSLGPLPRSTLPRMHNVLSEEWGRDLITSWNRHDWIGFPRRLGAKISQLIGAKPEEVLAVDTASINIFKLLSAAIQLNPGRRTILSESGNFPTDVYMIEGLASVTGGQVEQKLVEPEEIEAALNEDVAVLLLPHTHYKSGRVHDMQRITEKAQAVGALVIWDLCHTVGALPVDLNACHADFAVGCGYKYLNGGPGAPAFLFCAERHQDKVFPVLSGWLGHSKPFDFVDDFQPAPGIQRFQCSSPSILGLAALECGVDITIEAGMDALREKSIALCELFITLVGARTTGFTLASPRDATVRGSQVSFAHVHGYPIMQALISRGVIGDFRAPNLLRFGFTPLYVRYEDVWNAVDVLVDIMATQAWDTPEFHARAAVT